MNSIKVCEYSWSRSFHDDLIHVLQDQASGERSQDQWSSGQFILLTHVIKLQLMLKHFKHRYLNVVVHVLYILQIYLALAVSKLSLKLHFCIYYFLQFELLK